MIWDLDVGGRKGYAKLEDKFKGKGHTQRALEVGPQSRLRDMVKLKEAAIVKL